MLILTRKVNQGIWISGDILVRVLEVDRDRVKIGISAPDEVKILRQELWNEGEGIRTIEKHEEGETNNKGSPKVTTACA